MKWIFAVIEQYHREQQFTAYAGGRISVIIRKSYLVMKEAIETKGDNLEVISSLDRTVF